MEEKDDLKVTDKEKMSGMLAATPAADDSSNKAKFDYMVSIAESIQRKRRRAQRADLGVKRHLQGSWKDG